MKGRRIERIKEGSLERKRMFWTCNVMRVLER